MDLLLGNFIASPGLGVSIASPFTSVADRRIMAVCISLNCIKWWSSYYIVYIRPFNQRNPQIPLVLVAAIAMLVASMLLPVATGSLQFLYVSFWLLAALVCLQVWIRACAVIAYSLAFECHVLLECF